MGFRYPEDSNTVEVIKKNPLDMICVLLLQHADQLSVMLPEVNKEAKPEREKSLQELYNEGNL